MFKYANVDECLDLDEDLDQNFEVRPSQFNQDLFLVIWGENVRPQENIIVPLYDRAGRWPWYMIDEVSLIQGLTSWRWG